MWVIVMYYFEFGLEIVVFSGVSDVGCIGGKFGEWLIMYGYIIDV